MGLHSFKCACKAVEVEVSGDPWYQDYCHCIDCCKWNQQRPVGITLWPGDSLTVKGGSDSISRVCLVNPEFERLFCKTCGFRLYGQHTKMGFKSIPAVNLETLDFKPVSHVFCQDVPKDSLQRFKEDGLPKFAKLPAQFGGTDEQVQL